MFRVLFVLFVVIPIIEIAVLMQVGSLLGAWPTVAIVILTAWFGAKNVRQQGLSTMQSVQHKMNAGEMPSNEIITSFLLLVAGVLLITPGFITDAFGLLLLVPAVRSILLVNVQKHMATSAASKTFNAQGGRTFDAEYDSNAANDFSSSSASNHKPSANLHQGNTIEGEFERKD